MPRSGLNDFRLAEFRDRGQIISVDKHTQTGPDAESDLWEHIVMAMVLIEEREKLLGTQLSKTERAWLVRGAFRFKYGEIMGDAMADQVLAKMDESNAAG